MAFVVSRSAMSLAADDVALSTDDQAALNRAISTAAETVRSGSHVPWRGSGDIGGAVTPGPAYSNSTGAVCDRCTDPCRSITYTVVTPQALFEYRGTRCREADNADPAVPSWATSQRDERTRYLPAVVARIPPPSNPKHNTLQMPTGPIANPTVTATTAPPPGNPATGARPPLAGSASSDIAALSNDATSWSAATEMKHFVADMQTQLKILLYYKGSIDGKFGYSTKKALSEFLSDERSSYPPTPMYEVLQLLKSASTRITRTSCNSANGNQLGSNIACGIISK